MRTIVTNLKPVRLNYTIGEVQGDHEMFLNFDGGQIKFNIGQQMPGDVMPVSGATLTVKDRQPVLDDQPVNVDLYLGSLKVTGVRMSQNTVALITDAGGGEVLKVVNKRRTKISVPRWPSKQIYRSSYDLPRQETKLSLVAA